MLSIRSSGRRFEWQIRPRNRASLLRRIALTIGARDSRVPARIEGPPHKSMASATNAALDPAKSFQGLILTLQTFWAGHGCVMLQPYDMEVGAGTFHPATTLRSLGPKPWKAAYVQPSRRPKDGRYGENPNRLQHYYQFQVIMKPAPADIQELYLEKIGRAHV